MVQAKSGAAAQQLEALWASGTLTGMSDAQLLARFSEARDTQGEAAFRELIQRHGPMVMGVCWHILRRPHDADDAFQATFLVLVRKARSIRVRESLGPWLHSVAYRTALRARAQASRYQQTDIEPRDKSVTPEDDVFRLDLRPVLHEELGRLPDKYRAPIVLCHLEGKSQEEAARLLDWPLGTVSGRLSRGRQLLKSRLERRGLAAPSLLLPAVWHELSSPVSISLIEAAAANATRFAAAQAVPASIHVLTRGVLRTMLLHNLQIASVAALVIAAASGSAGLWAGLPSGAGQQPRPSAQPSQTAPRASIPEKASDRVLEQYYRELSQAAALGKPQSFPIFGSEVLALAYRGKTIDSLAAYSASTGEWSVVKLSKPVEGAINPTVGGNCALYQVGNDFYAFSGDRGAWDVLHLPGAALASKYSSLAQHFITVTQGSRLYVFSIKQGKWAQGIELNAPEHGESKGQAEQTPQKPQAEQTAQKPGTTN
jgi:RNA polymerase sigma factor (sigma-70 family)